MPKSVNVNGRICHIAAPQNAAATTSNGTGAGASERSRSALPGYDFFR